MAIKLNQFYLRRDTVWIFNSIDRGGFYRGIAFQKGRSYEVGVHGKNPSAQDQVIVNEFIPITPEVAKIAQS